VCHLNKGLEIDFEIIYGILRLDRAGVPSHEAGQMRRRRRVNEGARSAEYSMDPAAQLDQSGTVAMTKLHGKMTKVQ
jgi:hypothetical protein